MSPSEGISPLDKLFELATAEIDWQEFCQLARLCFPSEKTDEAAARHALSGAGDDVLASLAADWGTFARHVSQRHATSGPPIAPHIAAARKVRDTAKRYREMFGARWGAGNFDVDYNDWVSLEKRRLDRALARDPRVIDFSNAKIIVAGELRGVSARVVPAEVEPKAFESPLPSKPSKSQPGPKPGSGKLLAADRKLFPEIRTRLDAGGETLNAITLALVNAKCVAGNGDRASLARRLRKNFTNDQRAVGINSNTDI